MLPQCAQSKHPQPLTFDGCRGRGVLVAYAQRENHQAVRLSRVQWGKRALVAERDREDNRMMSVQRKEHASDFRAL